jgi:hypothetical protein
LTAIQRSRLSFPASLATPGEGPPEVGTGERTLGALVELLKPGTGALSDLLAEQPSQRVLQVPLALLKLDPWPALLDRLDHPAMRIANHARRLALERGEKGAPDGGMGGGEGLGMPQPGLAGAVADRAEDVEGDRPCGDAATLASSARIRNGMWSKNSEP